FSEDVGITFFSTPMSRGAAKILEVVGVPFWKVASSDILDFVLLDYLASTGRPVIVPTGMSSISEIDLCCEFLTRRSVPFILLHAISCYPYPIELSNLNTIRFLQRRYPGVAVGFSQNSPWPAPIVAAVCLGAKVVEQHFTLSRESWGP